MLFLLAVCMISTLTVFSVRGGSSCDKFVISGHCCGKNGEWFQEMSLNIPVL